jgi:hypothetical protein
MLARILQIVPRLPPYTDGVGDYALCLARQLQQDHQIDSHFLAFQQGLELAPEIQGFRVTGLSEPNRSSFLSVLPPDIDGILLQYSNYPYLKSKWDAPLWFVNALQSAIAQRSIPLAIMYHELPWLRWRKIRVLNPLQSLVSLRLGQLAKVIVTNNTQFQTILEGWLHRPVHCLPNFSTVGELTQPLPIQDRKKQLVIFGSTDRDRVYRYALSEILQLYDKLNLETVYDVGKPLNLRQRYFYRGINLVELGFQPAESVSQLLSQSLFCGLDYSLFQGNLGKSTIFAAACAHGVVPLCTDYNRSEADGLFLNQHYLPLKGSQAIWKEEILQEVANNAHQWYYNHSLKKNARSFANFILGNTNNDV